MNILILGGTQFVGRHIVEAFLAGDHHVSILTRGQTRDDLPDTVERLRGDRSQGQAGLDALAGRHWDACVDVSGYLPSAVRVSAEALRKRVGRYVLISTVSVYAEQGRHPVLESDPLLPPAPEDTAAVTGELYGPLKVTCEQVVQAAYGDRATLLRPQIVAGPHDHTGRYSYWPDRASRGGETLLPGNGEDHVQVIDARDLARFTLRVVEDGTGGVFNVAGPRLSWAAFAGVLGIQHPVWVDAATLEQQGVDFRALPLFMPDTGAQAGLMDIRVERAVQAGLTLTPPDVTARDTRAWSAQVNPAYALTPQREAEVIAAWREKER
ncbi:NAD-dependent epimerase/dehydratase family protein [Deinococcus taeanensis]|uniref:NAD-dependent epimerase/dehydratase family protein n=1 Tax=Deinococcus taeanensis TaxID=2737050 RepID=UPI001CDC4C7A|nr:NAD-dependent epimerase/dehydratase family protein [Deinococcus taeanensis]UBV42536.1 NAD-dependent epimerase/dehydratase family protein [Deinococcus taeanensis]